MGLLKLPRCLFDALKNAPQSAISAQLDNHNLEAQLLIPNYDNCLEQNYAKDVGASLAAVSDRAQIPFEFKHFGLLLRFSEPYELRAHNSELELLGDIKRLVAEFGVVMLHNAYLTADIRHLGHRNRFPHLNFHRDRNSSQPTPYSLYTRNPFDAEQEQPRISSTLFIANIVAYLQSLVEQQHQYTRETGVLSHYDIFHESFMHPLLNSVILEQKWDEPLGVGEISIIDNRSVLHSSYCRRKGLMGYRIGVRYLC